MPVGDLLRKQYISTYSNQLSLDYIAQYIYKRYGGTTSMKRRWIRDLLSLIKEITKDQEEVPVGYSPHTKYSILLRINAFVDCYFNDMCEYR